MFRHMDLNQALEDVLWRVVLQWHQGLSSTACSREVWITSSTSSFYAFYTLFGERAGNTAVDRARDQLESAGQSVESKTID